MKPKMMLMTTVCLILAVQEAVTLPVSMKLFTEFPDDGWVNINFYGDNFTEFYKCLSNNKSRTCAADLARDEKQPFNGHNRRAVRVEKPKIIDALENYSDFYTCRHIFPEEKIACTRLLSGVNSCETQNRALFFHMLVDSSLNDTCVSILWSLVGESLTYDERIHHIHVCERGCNSTIQSTSHPKIDQTKPNFQKPQINNHEDDDTDYHWGHFRRPKVDLKDTKSHIIIAVVVGMSVIAILIIGAGIFRRKLLQKRTKRNDDTEFVKPQTKDRKSAKSLKSVLSRKFHVPAPPRPGSVILNPSKLSSDI